MEAKSMVQGAGRLPWQATPAGNPGRCGGGVRMGGGGGGGSKERFNGGSPWTMPTLRLQWKARPCCAYSCPHCNSGCHRVRVSVTGTQFGMPAYCSDCNTCNSCMKTWAVCSHTLSVMACFARQKVRGVAVPELPVLSGSPA
eukprot:364635-Chlamydomonas_euryale.AAC.11